MRRWKRKMEGSKKNLINAIDRSANYRLVVFDNIFLSKSPEARKRLKQEWSNALSDSLKLPVVSLNEIQSRYQFGVKQAVRMAIFALLSALIVFGIFHYDTQIMAFLMRQDTFWRVISTGCILIFIPIFAYVYSSVTSLFLRMIKLD